MCVTSVLKKCEAMTHHPHLGENAQLMNHSSSLRFVFNGTDLYINQLVPLKYLCSICILKSGALVIVCELFMNI